MARSAILGNGELTVGLDEVGLINDFYFPFVGLDNLTTARSMHHKIGVWIDGEFSWTDDPSQWDVSVALSADFLVASVSLTSKNHPIKIHTEDFVDSKYNFFGRKIYVDNKSEETKNVRIFMHQVFQISRAGRSDTALYVPNKHYIYNYKGRTCLLIAGTTSQRETFDQYAVGSYGIEGKKGTYIDAEDGELSGSTVEHAGVDSVIRFSLEVPGGSTQAVNYWVVADDSQVACEQTHNLLLEKFDERLAETKQNWTNWLKISNEVTSNISNDKIDLFKKSMMIIKVHCDKGGGVIASADSSIYNYGRDYYNYVWPRDGALAIWPLIRLGYKDEAARFIKFCSDVCTDEGYLMHKYQPDKAVGSTWHSLLQNGSPELPIQEDETAILLVIVLEYYKKFDDEDFVRDVFDKFIIKAANFLCSYVDEETGLPHASYDLWEQKYITSTYTSAVVARGLASATELANKFGSETMSTKWQSMSSKIVGNFKVFINPDDNTLRKGFVYNTHTGSLDFDNTLDASSFYGALKFLGNNILPDVVNDTAKAINQNLRNKASTVGIARYPGDGYFKPSDELPANAWPIATMWMVQYYLTRGDMTAANELLQSVQDRVVSDCILSEQISSADGKAVSVAPLVWSHAEYINTVLEQL